MRCNLQVRCFFHCRTIVHWLFCFSIGSTSKRESYSFSSSEEGNTLIGIVYLDTIQEVVGSPLSREVDRTYHVSIEESLELERE